MKINRLAVILLVSILVFSCKKDDDGDTTVNLRDRGEQAIADDQAIIEYLSTHFYNYEEFENPPEGFDYEIVYDTIAGDNAGKTAIIESDKLFTKTINYEGVDQLLYVLKVREGAGEKPTFADSTYVGYRGELLDHTVFNSYYKASLWFDLGGYQYISNGTIRQDGGTILGFARGLEEFGGASGYEIQADNTVKWNDDYGIGALFIPSGLGYFAAPPTTKIGAYKPLVFSFKLYNVNQADHDGDGIPSYMEDLDGDKELFTDDTDGDGLANSSDTDDDGDGTPTRDEIEIDEETGAITLTDTNGDGTPDYLDPDFFKND
ncbi:MAG: hypothetical protein ABGW91_04005 [Christiangramia sp.]|uniref:peptidylprolyl isomerase n=1 Tax=Christiangramia flava JLT2011 TaxID=1229726 RepID=A0A1L7I0S2_9FLAO|nr:hypothetical protein [Christiangramia flava]APU67198.1 Calcium-binding protein [Christiangramia flava JLT2011]MAM20144.1 hypothetical protein [Christiangramia sp.]OSS39783.1 Calcium-binding protein [Christiangramia flava JLT2011]